MGSAQGAAIGWCSGQAMTTPRSQPRARRGIDPRPAYASVPSDHERGELIALVRGMAAGNQQALAEFYDRTIGKAYGLALRITGNAGLAEEAVGDAYYQAWRHAGEYDAQRAAPMTWLLIMCRSRALDALRARDPALLHDSPHDLVDPADLPQGSDTVDILASLEAGHAVHTAIAALTPVERQMIGLAFFRGLSHQEIAHFAGMPLGTVKSHIRRALQTLRRELPPGNEP
ncbi:MAG TPA: sigma-70 family RNA polymerase sigma factor [Burkholderiales bacterium]|nr:sigma-70 family RNA polymerase sigma factor [Burkholderiales bacterium]